MITVSRFSSDGFTPKRQDLFLEIFDFYLDPHNDLLYEKVSSYIDDREFHYTSEYFKELATIRYTDYELGVWVFLDCPINEPDEYVSGQLNHLSEGDKLGRKWWSAKIPEDTICYYPNPNIKTHTAIELSGFAAYIPASQIGKFIDIQELK